VSKNEKLWGGRFSEKTDSQAEDFSASIHYDKRLYLQDILGSIAHAKMLNKTAIISDQEAKAIIDGLNQIRNEIESGTFVFRKGLEDIHMNIENRLIEIAGNAGAKLHTARSRNDQIINDVRMYMKDQIDLIIGKVLSLQSAFLRKASEYKDTVMPGFTHLQHAQPVLVSHHLLAYVSMLDRDKRRLKDCRKRTDVMGLGCCALAGTPLPIDRSITAKELSFPEISRNSIDAVSDRDFILEFLSVVSILGTHLSRLAEELVLWTSSEFDFVTLPDSFCTGSSIMPQKKNPDMAELVRGKTGRLNGNLIALLTTMKGLPLTYNRDMQEDKEPLFDSIDTVNGMLTVCTGMIENISFNKKRLSKSASENFILATEIADYLVIKKLPFRSAHEIVGKIVAYCLSEKKDFPELTIDEWKKFSGLFESDILDILTVKSSIERKKSYGGTSVHQVEQQLKHWQATLKENRNNE